jgi:ergothioneine biosynthesis protein EgtB
MKRLKTVDRAVLVEWYRRNRARSKVLFGLIRDAAYYSRPIALCHPIVFYEGHLPAFSFNTLVKRGLGRKSIDARLEAMFARGIDPHEAAWPDRTAASDTTAGWPSRDAVHRFADEADRQVLDALEHADLHGRDHPMLDRGEAAFAILEHEAMHQETLLYMWHRLPFDMKLRPSSYVAPGDSAVPHQEWIDVPSGRATLGLDRDTLTFGWDNERPGAIACVNSFHIQRHNVTNAAFLEFLEAGGYRDRRWWLPDDWNWIQTENIGHPLFWELHDGAWCWRGMFDLVPLRASWPVYVSHAEARAYAEWHGGRLPTEPEFQRAAFGTPSGAERTYPCGDDPPTAERGAFDVSAWDLHPAGSHPAGRRVWCIDDLVGNGWEWTSTVFAPFPGFAPMPSYPEYSADFFDGEHYVMKGASPATARELLRPTFRNWFRGRYPYVYATFRCARTVN